jgi:hypothetical protein
MVGNAQTQSELRIHSLSALVSIQAKSGSTSHLLFFLSDERGAATLAQRYTRSDITGSGTPRRGRTISPPCIPSAFLETPPTGRDCLLRAGPQGAAVAARPRRLSQFAALARFWNWHTAAERECRYRRRVSEDKRATGSAPVGFFVLSFAYEVQAHGRPESTTREAPPFKNSHGSAAISHLCEPQPILRTDKKDRLRTNGR